MALGAVVGVVFGPEAGVRLGSAGVVAGTPCAAALTDNETKPQRSQKREVFAIADTRNRGMPQDNSFIAIPPANWLAIDSGDLQGTGAESPERFAFVFL